MDARRLGHPLLLPHALLAGGPGYLSDQDWNPGDNWLEEALALTGAPCHGIPGPVTRLKPRPNEHHDAAQPRYRLADYLEQMGRAQRAGVFPPAAFWTVLAHAVTDPDVLYELPSASMAGVQARAGIAVMAVRSGSVMANPME